MVCEGQRIIGYDPEYSFRQKDICDLQTDFMPIVLLCMSYFSTLVF